MDLLITAFIAKGAKCQSITQPHLSSFFESEYPSVTYSDVFKGIIMKKLTVYILVFSMITAVLASTLVGCSRSDSDDYVDPPDSAVIGGAVGDSAKVFNQTFSISLSTLSGHLPNISNVLIDGDTLYFTSTEYKGAHSLTHTTSIFSADISDLDNIVLTELTNYSVPPLPADKYVGGVFVTSMQVDNNGYLWIAETHWFNSFDVPHGFDIDNAESEELHEFESTLETYRVIRKLDNLGAEIRYIDLSELSTQRDWLGVVAFNIDDNENIFIGSGATVYVLNSIGESLFNLEASGFIGLNSFIRLHDGAIAVVSTNTATSLTDVQIIDTHNNAWSMIYTLDSVVHAVYSGDDENYFLYNSGTALFGVEHKTNDTVRILDWTESGVTAGEIGNLSALDDERIIFTHLDYEGFQMTGSGPDIILIVLSVIDPSVLQEVTTLTVARFGLSNFAINGVSRFNRTNDLYRIEIIDYFVDDGGWIPPGAYQEARKRFILDVLAGNAPDILILYPDMYGDLVGSGLLLDLYDFIDRDTELNRSDFLQDIFRKSEVDGAMYRIFPFFQVGTIFGNPDIVGSSPGWNITDFINVLEANPQASIPTGRHGGLESFLRLVFSTDDYINWGNVGICYSALFGR
jgi:hypothetical protein